VGTNRLPTAIPLNENIRETVLLANFFAIVLESFRYETVSNGTIAEDPDCQFVPANCFEFQLAGF
jgi:hypothetical protein